MEHETQRLTTGEKLSYGLVTLGNIPIMVLINSFLLIFYTDVIGLNPAAVGTLFLVSRFFDAANDPIIGYILDHRKASKGGRFRPVLALFGIITALNFLLLWFAGVWAPAGKLVVVYIVYLLFSITFTVLDIGGNSLLAVSTQYSGDRETLSVLKGICQILGGTIVGIAAPIVLGGAMSQITGYYYLIFVVTVVIALFTTIGAKGIKEHVKIDPQASKYSLRDVLRIFTHKPLVAVLLLYLTTGLGSSLQTSVNAFFFTYIIGDLTLMGLVTASSIVGMVLSFVFIKPMLNRMGKKWVAISSMILLTLGCLVRLINPTFIPLQITGSIIGNFGMGLFTTSLPAMLADNIDAIGASMGFRAEGVVFSLSSFIAKITMGLGGAFPGYILAAIGYQAGSSSQTEGVNAAIIVMLLVVPAVFYIISGTVFGLGYKLPKSSINKQS
jgi:GPH family glycoside/pentoside/hexuronide:cation symporter/glucuronide carrier protein